MFEGALPQPPAAAANHRVPRGKSAKQCLKGLFLRPQQQEQISASHLGHAIEEYQSENPFLIPPDQVLGALTSEKSFLADVAAAQLSKEAQYVLQGQ
ncbi:hypothetical protein NDU88_004462 [Pleurodeles waltl]|uniref:Uncharacterized protein n=1 Tax=Pleurodeles waltl TaxID=8319 RepID=A0AAV7SIY9_PLEWA|nr:hypothetical protein NDU88_004462 [Pleurodeles waltl]